MAVTHRGFSGKGTAAQCYNKKNKIKATQTVVALDPDSDGQMDRGQGTDHCSLVQ